MTEHSAKNKGAAQTGSAVGKAGPEAATLQDNRSATAGSVQRKANNTGLPDNLKSGIENLSGHSMDDVKVHYNSSAPAQLNAHAYAQGNQIHVAPGQEKHVPHEAWHVVQQKEGRVRPTMQMKGKVNVNDDSGLEREADVMGAKALAGNQHTVQKAQCRSSSPVQMVKVAQLAKAVQKPQEEDLLDKIIAYAEKVQPSLDDDDDQEELESAVDHAKSMARSVKNFTIKKNKAPYSTRRPQRGKKKKVLRLDAETKEDFQELINDRMRILRRIYIDIKNDFVVHTGGFGAKGRAHDMDAQVIGEGVDTDKNIDNTFISDITINGTTLTDENKVTKPVEHAGESVGPLKVMGHNRNAHDNRNGLLAQTEGGITPLSNATWSPPPFKGAPKSMDRGDGQYANMNKTNANGYAWLWQVPGWNTQRWEWLHVRGAGLGGATNGTNLVLGTRDANTQMIPFESNVRVLGAAVPGSANYEELKVDWSVAGVNGHKVNQIGIDWELIPKDGVNPTEISGSARFNPLHTGSNISKAEIKHLEDALKAARTDATND